MQDAETTRMSVTFPDPLLQRLRQVAAREHRSVHGQLLVYLERGLAADDRDQDQRSGR